MTLLKSSHSQAFPMYFSQSHSEQIPHLDLSKRGKSGYSGNSSKSGDSCESGILVILRNLVILMFLVNWGIMVIMMNLSNFCDSGESDGSGDSEKFVHGSEQIPIVWLFLVDPSHMSWYLWNDACGCEQNCFSFPNGKSLESIRSCCGCQFLLKIICQRR